MKQAASSSPQYYGSTTEGTSPSETNDNDDNNEDDAMFMTPIRGFSDPEHDALDHPLLRPRSDDNVNNGSEHQNDDAWTIWSTLLSVWNRLLGWRTYVIIATWLVLVAAIWWDATERSVAILPTNATTVATHSTTTTTSSSSSSCSSNNTYAKAAVTDLAHAAVATDKAVCSQMGRDILHRGNAVDAAVTVALCLGVANPASSGLGGGAFILVRGDLNENVNIDAVPFRDERQSTSKIGSSNKVYEVIDAREVAPNAASTYMYGHASDDDDTSDDDTSDRPSSLYGGLAAAVPGELRGLALAHARFGSLPWSELVQPAYELALQGTPVTPWLESEIQTTLDTVADIPASWRRSFVRQDHRGLAVGDTYRNPALAATLLRIRDHGADAFYTGPAAAQLAEDVGGLLTADDLADYRPVLRSPVVAHNVGGYTLVGVPPPSSGGATLLGIARTMAAYAPEPLAARADTLTPHRLSEACKHAFALRMSLSDPDFDNPAYEIWNNSQTVQQVVDDLVATDYMDELRKHYTQDNTTQPLRRYGGPKWAQLHDKDAQQVDKMRQPGDRKLLRHFGYLNDHGTSHFNIVDVDGNAVAMTTSINTVFGSLVMTRSGVLMGNTMDDFGQPGGANYFGLRPSPANFIQPGKRPLSSMSPTMVVKADSSNSDDDNKNNDLVLAIGASGGPRIITAVMSVILNLLWLNHPPLAAILQPRVHDQLLFDGAAVTQVEDSSLTRVTDRTREALRRRHHALVDLDYTASVQVIARDEETGRWTAVSDPRKGGVPAGY